MIMKYSLVISLTFLLTGGCFGQPSVSLSVPMLWGKVQVKDNWTPSTAPNYKEYLTGFSVSSGIHIHGSFQPGFVIKNKNILFNIGAGYFYQRFDVNRPFEYRSMVEPIFYTDHYSYLCYHGDVGLTYKHTINSEKYFMTYNITYRVLKSFQQNYTPTYSVGTDFYTMIDRRHINFGKMMLLSVGLNRRVGNQLSIGVNAIAPLYIQWRNDAVFNDDPATLYRPGFSLGVSLSISYDFKRKQPS